MRSVLVFLSLLGIDAPGRSRFVGALQELCADVVETPLAPVGFNVLNGEAIAAGGSPVGSCDAASDAFACAMT
jgi:hypothetical protein